MDPEVDWAPALGPLLGVGPVRGKEALRRFLTEDIPSGFDRFESRPLSIEDLGNWCSSTRASSGEAVPAACPFPWRRSIDLARRKNRFLPGFRNEGSRPRSRRAQGVGDVAGEPGDSEGRCRRLNRGGVEVLVAGMAPDFVWDASPTGIPGLGVYRGRDEIRTFFEEDWFAAFPFEEWDLEVRASTRGSGDRHVLPAGPRRGQRGGG